MLLFIQSDHTYSTPSLLCLIFSGVIGHLLQSMSTEFSSLFESYLLLLIFVAEHGTSEDAIQRQSPSRASPSAAASTDDGAAAGPDSDWFRLVQEPLDPIAAENMPDMRPGMLRN